MSEKRFGYGETDLFEWVEDNGKMISTKECVDLLNEQQDIIYSLQQKIDAYERLITNSYEGKEETLDGYDGMYVIWESELKEWRKKYE